MSQLPWRILVVTDLGVDGREPATVTTDTLAAWFASQLASITLPGSGSLAVGSIEALSPAALRDAGVDASLLDAVLHDPRTQRLEAAWRGLAFLLQHAGGPVRVEALSLPKAAPSGRA